MQCMLVHVNDWLAHHVKLLKIECCGLIELFAAKFCLNKARTSLQREYGRLHCVCEAHTLTRLPCLGTVQPQSAAISLYMFFKLDGIGSPAGTEKLRPAGMNRHGVKPPCI